MECKYLAKLDMRSGIEELIETLWNVNAGVTDRIFGSVPELIETLWNVNK